MLVSLEEEIRTQTCTVERSCENKGRTQPSTSQGERSENESYLTNTLILKFQPPKLSESKFVLFKYLVSNTLLWQPQHITMLYKRGHHFIIVFKQLSTGPKGTATYLPKHYWEREKKNKKKHQCSQVLLSNFYYNINNKAQIKWKLTQ